MYVKRYICPNKAYQWELVKYIPVQFVGVRENIRHYLDLDDLEIIYFWKDEIVTEDKSSDYYVHSSRSELCVQSFPSKDSLFYYSLVFHYTIYFYMIRSYKIELKPNQEQISMVFKHCGIARYAYNWALENHTFKKDIAKRESEKLGLNKPNYPKIVVNDWYREFANLRDTTHTWIKPVAKDCWHEAFRNLR